jgi:WD domain, G-beta repeat
VTTPTTNPVEKLVAARLLQHAVAGGGDGGGPYLRRYLAEHVAEAGLWPELAGQIAVLDGLDPDSVAVEAFRTAYGRGYLPAAIAVTMAARNELRSPASAEQRRLTKALMSARLGLDEPLLRDPRVRWTQLAPTRPHLPLPGHLGRTAVAFGRLPDGRTLLATADFGGSVRLWDPTTGTPTGDPIPAHPYAVQAIAFGRLPDGRTLLATAGDDDGTVRLWDPATGTPTGDPLLAHPGGVTALAFGTLPDGRTLLATTSDSTVRLWDAGPAHMAPLHTYGVAPSVVRVIHLEGATLFLGCVDGLIVLEVSSDVGMVPVAVAEAGSA